MSKGKRKSAKQPTVLCPICEKTLILPVEEIREMLMPLGLTVSESLPNASSTPTKERDPIKETLQRKNALYRRQMIANARQG